MTPTEALQLLEVSSDAPKEEIRRAYLRKAKGCKPERDPAGFRRLRDAYEIVIETFASPETAVSRSEGRGVRVSAPRPPSAPEPAAPPSVSFEIASADPAGVEVEASASNPIEPPASEPLDPIDGPSPSDSAAEQLELASIANLISSDPEERLEQVERGELDVRSVGVHELEDRVLDRVAREDLDGAKRLLARLRAVLAAHGAELELIRRGAAVRHAHVRALVGIAPKLTPPIATAIATYLRDGDHGERATLAPASGWNGTARARQALATIQSESADLAATTAWYLGVFAAETDRRHHRSRLLLIPGTLLLLWACYAVFSLGVDLALHTGPESVRDNLRMSALGLIAVFFVIGVVGFIVWAASAVERALGSRGVRLRIGPAHLVVVLMLLALGRGIQQGIATPPTPSTPPTLPPPSPGPTSFPSDPRRRSPSGVGPSASMQEQFRRAFASASTAPFPSSVSPRTPSRPPPPLRP